jgi:two-component system, NtrC family, response regulator HydG
MPSLIISRDSHFHQVLSLKAKTHIGRSPDNDIILDAAGVSRHHATIEASPEGYFVIDQGSTNGTFVEDQRIDRQRLTNGVTFRILNYLLTFVKDTLAKEARPSPSISTEALLDTGTEEFNQTLWMTQHISPKQGLQQKTARLLKLLFDLYASPADADPGALVLEALFEITGAKRGMVVLQERDGEPNFTHVRGFETAGARPKVSRTIIQKALAESTSILRRMAVEEDPTQSILALELKSVLCVPLPPREKTKGCIYLDHPNRVGVFSDSDRDLLVAAAAYIGEALGPDNLRGNGLGREQERLAKELAGQGVIARSPLTLKVFQDARTIARYNVAVLIFGETGTGKEVIARYIHNHSGRKGKFIARNCNAMAASMFESELFGHEKGAFTGASERKLGIFELANGGTIFLDEIGDMPETLQTKLLRTLQEQEIWRVGGSAPVKIDVRVIAATHKDIKNKRQELNFRDDLYYRLANVEITAPSLRERPEDIGPLSDLILLALSQENPTEKGTLRLSTKTLRLLEAYDWPGNIRELRNTLIQIVMRCGCQTIEPRHLKGFLDVYATAPAKAGRHLPPLVEVERVHIIKALERTNWNKSAAAKVLQVDRNRLNRRLKKLGIETPGED